MKKIIVCALLLTTNVFAENITGYSSAWQVGIPYNTPVSDQSVIGKYGSAVTVIIAREIYENGGKFCPTRIMENSASSYENVTLYYRNNPMFTCYTICKPGYYGNTCEKKGTPSICGNTNYESVLKDRLKIDTKSDVSLSSYNISAFTAGSDTSGYGLSQVETYQLTTLGIIGYVDYGVIVAPIKISTSGMLGGTISVNTNNRSTTLCASGYELDGGKCVKPANCPIIVPKKPNNNGSTGETEYCEGYNYYDSVKHDLVKEASCYSYRCKKGGFDPDSNRKDCIEDCGETKQSGVLDDGVCKKCNTGQVFNEDEPDGCKEASSSISREKMLNGIYNVGKCWMESSPHVYKDCVFCERTWYEKYNQCE